MISIESRSFVAPPNIIVPRHSRDTLTPALPRFLYSIFHCPGLVDRNVTARTGLTNPMYRRNKGPFCVLGQPVGIQNTALLQWTHQALRCTLPSCGAGGGALLGIWKRAFEFPILALEFP
jgi:hypothetical protein